MEHQAVKCVLLESFHDAHIQQHSSVERAVTCLLHHINGVLELLPLQEGVHVVDEGRQVTRTVPVRDDDGHLVPRRAVLRLVISSESELRVRALLLLQAGRVPVDLYPPLQGRGVRRARGSAVAVCVISAVAAAEAERVGG